MTWTGHGRFLLDRTLPLTPEPRKRKPSPRATAECWPYVKLGEIRLRSARKSFSVLRSPVPAITTLRDSAAMPRHVSKTSWESGPGLCLAFKK